MNKYYETFLFEDKATIKSIENKDGFLLIELDDTIFFPGGGGQPYDIGVMKTDSFEGEVVKVYRENDLIIHKVKPKQGTLKQNDSVTLKIDEDRRIKLVRMHTGEHVLFKALEKEFGDVKLTKIDLDEEESSLFINTEKLTWEGLFKAEEMVNSIIEEDKPMIEKQYTKEEAIKLGKLRIKPERIKGDLVRVVEVDDFDWSACTGIHAKTTGFVGNLLITKFNFVKGSWEIRYKTNVKKALYDLAKITRQSASLLGTDTDAILSSIERLQEESVQYKEKFREISYNLLDSYDKENIDGITFISKVVEEVEKKQLIEKSASLLKEKTVVFFVNKEDGRAMVLLNTSEDLKINAAELLNEVLSKFKGKGGGRNNFAMGSVEDKYVDDVIKEIKILIGKV